MSIHMIGTARALRVQIASLGAIVAALIACTLGSVVLAHPGGTDAQGCHQDASAGERHCHGASPPAKDLAKRDSSRPPRAGDEGVFYGPLVRVVDGDTLKVKVQGVVMDFRLAEVDAPESDQPYGSDAKRELLSLVRNQSLLVVVPFDTDRYGRTVAWVWVRDLEVNREMVKRGAAWFYSRYSRSETLYHIEEEARDAKRGLWALPLADRTEPWIWRQERREEEAQRAQVKKL